MGPVSGIEPCGLVRCHILRCGCGSGVGITHQSLGEIGQRRSSRGSGKCSKLAVLEKFCRVKVKMKKPPHFAEAFQNFRCTLFRGASEEFLVLKCLSIVYALEGGRSSKHGYVYVGVSLSSPRQFGLKSYISLVIHLRSPSQILNYNLLDH